MKDTLAPQFNFHQLHPSVSQQGKSQVNCLFLCTGNAHCFVLIRNVITQFQLLRYMNLNNKILNSTEKTVNLKLLWRSSKIFAFFVFKVGADCLIGESTMLGNTVTIKKTFVGKHCKIGSNVRIANSVIMDHVNISDGYDYYIKFDIKLALCC